MKFELEPDYKNITDEELIADLKRVVFELKTDSLTQREYKEHGKFNISIFVYRFYGWSKALETAGLKNGHSRTKIRMQDEELIADLKRVSSELKNDSLTRDEYNRHGKFHSSTLEARFGSWIKAKEKAELKRRAHLRISDEEYLKNLEEVWIKLGKQPHFSDMKMPLSKYSGTGYQRRFGSWRMALEQFIDYVNDEETIIDGKSSLVINEEELHQAPIIEYSKKELVSELIDKKLLAKTSNTSQRFIDTHKTKRGVGHRLRFIVMRRDNFKCQSCGRSPATDQSIILHVDHMKSWAKGGETYLENLQTLCSVCNIGKSDLD